MYFAPLLGLLGLCGMPALLAAGFVFVGYAVYAVVMRRR